MKMTQPEISVCICTLNPHPETFKKAIIALGEQSLEHSKWEIVVVDNDSDESVEHGYHVDFAWHPTVKFVHERPRGFGDARRRAIREARAELIVFVDDDCILASDYLERACAILANYTSVGVLTGNISLKAPIGITGLGKEMHEHIYTGSQFTGFIRTNHRSSYTRAMAGGSGMAIRKAVGTAYLRRHEFDRELQRRLHRAGLPSLRYEDIDISMCALFSGFEIARSGDLNLVHEHNRAELMLRELVSLAYRTGFNDELFRIRWEWSTLPRTKFHAFFHLARGLVTLAPRSPGDWGVRVAMHVGTLNARLFYLDNKDLLERAIT